MGGWCGEDSVSRAIGGYVRRCERKPSGPTVPLRDGAWLRHAVLPSGAVITWRAEPPQFQSAPILNFVPFEVSNGE